MTRVKGKTRWTPGGRTLEDTLPNRSFTPTWPAGTTVIGPPMTINTKTTRAMIALRTKREPEPEGGTISKVLFMLSPGCDGAGGPRRA